MKKLLKILLVLFISLPVIVFGAAENNPVSAKISGDYSYQLIDDNSVEILNYAGSEQNLVIPREIDGKVVKKIGYGAFAECKSIVTVDIPDSIISLGDYAFSHCSQIEKISLPDSIVSMGQYSFAGCSSLTSVKIPNEISTISYATFFDCTNLTDITIPNGIKNIGGMVFGSCKSLESIDLPDTLTTIGNNVFSNCTALENIVIPEGVTVLGSGSFQGCLKLNNVSLPSTLTGIGQNAFQDCISLESIYIPEKVSAIGYGAFTGCTSLKTVNIPSKVTSIRNATFSGCASLESITIPDNITTLGDNVFSGCVNLKNVVIPDTVTEIGAATFSYCSSLKNIKLPSDLEVINANLFRYCDNLETVVIPNGVTSVKDTAFADCMNLKSVTFPNTIQDTATEGLGSRIFSNSPKVIASVIEGSVAHTYMRRNNYNFILIATGINLNNKEITLNVGNSLEYTAILSPYSIIDNSSLIWESSNPSVATVKNGVVTAISEGEAKITVKTTNGLSDTSDVIVTNINAPITDVTLNFSSIEMKKDTSTGLKATITPKDTTDDTTLTWESDNNEIVTVSSTGTLTARKPGTAKITVRTSNGLTDTCDVTVISEITSVNLNSTAIVLDEGVSQTLRATINPIDATGDKTLTWKSSNSNVATVDQEGTVTAVKEGFATITVTTVNGKKAECKITVNKPAEIIPIESVSLNKTELTLEEDQSELLEATINPSNTTDDKTLTWESNDPTVATVDQEGNVTAVKEGTATITVTTVNGKEATCEVAVSKKPVPIQSVSLNKTELELEEGQSETLEATINPSNTTDDKTLTWESNDPTVATVDQEGNVTAVKEGTATITVTTVNGKEATCEVTVNKKLVPIQSVSLNKAELALEEGQSELLEATINPSNTTDDKTLTWESNDPTVATVDQEGNVTAVKEGTATITVTTVNGKEATCEVTVSKKPVPIQSVSLNKTSLTLKAGNVATLEATINPSNTTDDKTLTWESNDPTVATVDQEGNVTAVKEGTAIITVTTVNGKKATCEVTVFEILTDELEALVAHAKTIDENSYTATSYEALKTAILNSEAVLSNDEATQEDVDLATESLQQAIDNLVERASQTLLDTLKEKLEECKAMEANYSSEEFSKMLAVIADVEELLANGDVNIAMVEANEALEQLTVEEDALYLISAIKELNVTLEEANKILVGDLSGYTTESVEALKAALKEAQDLIDSGSKDISLIKQANEALNTAIENLVKVDVDTNKASLRSVIVIAQQMMENIDRYRPETVAGLEELLQAAIDVNNNNEVTQDQIDTITEELVLAILNARLDPTK